MCSNSTAATGCCAAAGECGVSESDATAVALYLSEVDVPD